MSAYETKKTANDALNTANDALPKTTDVVTVGAPGVGMSNARELVAGSGVSLSTTTPGQLSISAPGVQWNLYGAYSARPAAGTAGRIYVRTDAPSFVDTGSEWKVIPPACSGQISPTGVYTDYTALNQGTATYSNATGGIVTISAPASGAGEWHRMLYKPLVTAGGAYRIRAAFRPLFIQGSYPAIGVLVMSPTGGANWAWTTAHATCTVDVVGGGSHYGTWNGATMTYGGAYPNNLVAISTTDAGTRNAAVMWWELYCDGVTRTWRRSFDGTTWEDIGSQAALANLTVEPTRWAIYANPQNAGARGVFFGAEASTT